MAAPLSYLARNTRQAISAFCAIRLDGRRNGGFGTWEHVESAQAGERWRLRFYQLVESRSAALAQAHRSLTATAWLRAGKTLRASSAIMRRFTHTGHTEQSTPKCHEMIAYGRR
jgi:hypothetical protein